jgi:hypothetical protein
MAGMTGSFVTSKFGCKDWRFGGELEFVGFALEGFRNSRFPKVYNWV